MNTFKIGLVLGATMLASVGVAQAQQTIRAGITNAANLWVRNDAKTGAPTGPAIDIIEAIAKDVGFALKYEPMDVTALSMALADNKIDIIAYPLSVSPERQALHDFSSSYATIGNGLVVKKMDTKQYVTYDDLKGLSVGALPGTVIVPLLEKAGANIKTYTGSTAAITDLNSGKIDAVVSAAPNQLYFIQIGQFPEIRYVKTFKGGDATASGIGVRKTDADLMAKINKSLAKLEADGTLKAIFAKYDIDRGALGN